MISALLLAAFIVANVPPTFELPRDQKAKPFIIEDTVIVFAPDTSVTICQYKGKPLAPGWYWFQLAAFTSDGRQSQRTKRQWIYIVGALEGKKDFEQRVSPGAIVKDFAPNPARDATSIFVDLDRAGPVRVDLFDVAGRLVLERAVDTIRPAGDHPLFVNVSRLPAGVYFARIDAAGARIVRKLIVVK